MQFVRLHRKLEGTPVQVGISKGGLYAYMIGTQQFTKEGQLLERPVVFVASAPNQISSPDQWIAIPQLIRFSQPNTWFFDEDAIATTMRQLGIPDPTP
ncbi:MAG TPA: hypothetical protein V6D19_02605 [Stenomitos sp.]